MLMFPNVFCLPTWSEFNFRFVAHTMYFSLSIDRTQLMWFWHIQNIRTLFYIQQRCIRSIKKKTIVATVQANLMSGITCRCGWRKRAQALKQHASHYLTLIRLSLKLSLLNRFKPSHALLCDGWSTLYTICIIGHVFRFYSLNELCHNQLPHAIYIYLCVYLVEFRCFSSFDHPIPHFPTAFIRFQYLLVVDVSVLFLLYSFFVLHCMVEHRIHWCSHVFCSILERFIHFNWIKHAIIFHISCM